MVVNVLADAHNDLVRLGDCVGHIFGQLGQRRLFFWLDGLNSSGEVVCLDRVVRHDARVRVRGLVGRHGDG